MKLAEVIPFYKGKSMDLMVNYRPISLLITLSKLLEKVNISDCTHTWNPNQSYTPANMDFTQRYHVNKLYPN